MGAKENPEEEKDEDEEATSRDALLGSKVSGAKVSGSKASGAKASGTKASGAKDDLSGRLTPTAGPLPPPKSGLSSVFPKRTASTPRGTPAGSNAKTTPPPPLSPSARAAPGSPTSRPPAPPAFKVNPPIVHVPMPPPLPAAAKPAHGEPPSATGPSFLPPPPTQERPKTGFDFKRSRTYAFALDEQGNPIVLGSGRFSRLYLGYERWEEALTHQQRPVVIKMLQQDLEDDDVTRFRQEKALLEYLQGHPSIVEMLGSGTIDESALPTFIKTSCEGDFLILEKLDMTLMERLKGSRDPRAKEDLGALAMQDRLVRVLEYVIPVASAVEFAHLVRNVSHRDINPSNILLKLPDQKLAGSTLQVRLSDFSAARMDRHEGVTRIGAGVPGTMYFQSPEQETNLLGLLVNVKQGSKDVEYFEDFFLPLAKNDTFALVNRNQQYVIREVDRSKKRIVLDRPFAEESEEQVRANVQKRVGRPADIYAIGAILYYLISGAVRNPKALNDTFRKFDEYDRGGTDSSIEAYLRSEYEMLDAARSRAETERKGGVFRYQHFVDAGDEPIPFEVMRIVARCMIRNKPDSYCASNDLETTAITDVVRDLLALHTRFGLAPAVGTRGAPAAASPLARYGTRAKDAFVRIYDALLALLGRKRR